MRQVDTFIQWHEPSLNEERERRRVALTQYTERLKDALHPACIILFGSVARGTDKVWSDLDVVLIGGSLPDKLFERLRVVGRLKRGLLASIDAFPYTEAEFEHMIENAHLTALESIHHGVPLHGEAYFQRLIVKFNTLLVKQGWRRTDQGWIASPQAS
jgi:predicted nucleotidyltransferase